MCLILTSAIKIVCILNLAEFAESGPHQDIYLTKASTGGKKDKSLAAEPYGI